MQRCSWCGHEPLYIHYHDQEWGVPEYDSRKLFELLILETMQAGLSWLTILRKRENFRQAFANFDPYQIVDYSPEKVAALLANPGIVRNRLKIQATLNNAAAFIQLEQNGGFSDFIWNFTGGNSIHNAWQTTSQIPTRTDISDRLSKALKKHGFSFVGTTICYAYMQAIGMVNDHVQSCFRYNEILNHHVSKEKK